MTQKETDAAGVETPRKAEQTGDNNTQNEGEGVGMRTTTRQPPSVVNPPSFPNLDSQKSPSEQIQTETLNKTATYNPSQTGSSLRLGEILTRTPLNQTTITATSTASTENPSSTPTPVGNLSTTPTPVGISSPDQNTKGTDKTNSSDGKTLKTDLRKATNTYTPRSSDASLRYTSGNTNHKQTLRFTPGLLGNYQF